MDCGNFITIYANEYESVTADIHPDMDVKELKEIVAEAFDSDEALFDLLFEGEIMKTEGKVCISLLNFIYSCSTTKRNNNNNNNNKTTTKQQQQQVTSHGIIPGSELYSEPSSKARAIKTLGKHPTTDDMKQAIINGEDIIPYIEAGLSINCNLGFGVTPLCVAIELLREDIATYLLLQSGIDTSACGPDLNTPLHRACSKGMLSVVKDIIKNSQVTVNISNRFRATPLTRACEKGHIDIVRELLQNSADVNKYSSIGTPLIICSIRGYSNIAKELLSVEGIDINLNLGNGTALHDACALNRYEIVELLLSTPDIRVNVSCPPWGTALHNAVRKGHLPLVDMLISRSDINLRPVDSHGNTPLHVAAIYGYFDIAERLLAHRLTNNNLKNQSEETALDCARNRRHTDIVQLILEKNNRLETAARCSSIIRWASLSVYMIGLLHFRLRMKR